MFFKKVFFICLLFFSQIAYSEKDNSKVHDEYMPPGDYMEILFESPNYGMSSKMILYFTVNIFVYVREDLFRDMSKKLSYIEKYEKFMEEESLRDYFSDHTTLDFLYGRINLEGEYLTLKLYFIDEKTNELKVKMFREGNRRKISEVERIIERIDEEEYPVPKIKYTTIPKENIAIITRKIKYFGSNIGISGNYKELYEKVIEIFKDKLPSIVHYVRRPEFELINE